MDSLTPDIPYAEIDTVFLDVGNTLISIDFDWVAGEICERGIQCDAASLRRAEAAARPTYSRSLFVDGLPAGTDFFWSYLAAMLECAPPTSGLSRDAFDGLVTDLRRVLRPDGRASVLWRSVMPGVPEALEQLQALGVTLVVVSNSDGTVERSLEDAGLRQYLSAVIDSALAGYEKPDARIFTRALTLAGARAERTVHVGDLYHADVMGARRAGLHGLLLDPYGDWCDADCARASNLTEVAERLRSAR